MPPRRGIRRLTQCLLTKRPDSEAVKRREGESADITRIDLRAQLRGSR